MFLDLVWSPEDILKRTKKIIDSSAGQERNEFIGITKDIEH